MKAVLVDVAFTVRVIVRDGVKDSLDFSSTEIAEVEKKVKACIANRETRENIMVVEDDEEVPYGDALEDNL